MRRTARYAAVLWAALVPFGAGANPVAEAEAAGLALQRAAIALNEARSAEDRIAALTQTVRAYEGGLASLRAGLREATIRERSIEARLSADEARIGALLGALLTMQRTPAPVTLVHPEGPVGAARAGMMVADIAPGLQDQAEALRLDVQNLALIRRTREAAVAQMEDGLKGAQAARLELAEAMAARTGRLPTRTDPVLLQGLIAGADTLDAFALGLAAAAEPAVDPGFAARQGQLALPVAGALLHGFNAPDQAGVPRPGWVLATTEGALVSTPAPATVRYAGPLLDYGNVIILEPESPYLMILAGLDTLFGRTGDILSAGDPVGLMGGEDLPQARIDGGQTRRETLYLELRQGSAPVDPASWFRRVNDS